MKHKSIFIIVIIMVLLNFTESRLAIGQQKPPTIPTLDKIAESVVFLQSPPKTNPGTNRQETYIGTGFLVNLNEHLFLTTASHVAKLITAASSITFGTQDNIAQTIPISDMMVTSGNPEWIFHETADVAVLYLQPKHELASILLSRALLPSQINSKLNAPERSRILTVIGFPLGLGVSFSPNAKLSPITKESKPISGLITLPRFDTKTPSEFFLLDSPSVGGFSGSPIFILPGSFSDGLNIHFSIAAACMGLIHGTLSDDTGGKFAAVVPAAFIVNTLDIAYAKIIQKK